MQQNVLAFSGAELNYFQHRKFEVLLKNFRWYWQAVEHILRPESQVCPFLSNDQLSTRLQLFCLVLFRRSRPWINRICTTPWRRMGEWRCSSTIS